MKLTTTLSNSRPLAAPEPPHVFSPADVAGLSFWLRADQGATLSGAEVTAYEDQSPSGNDLVKGTTGPTYVAAATANGKPGFTFGGTKLLTRANPVDLPESATPRAVFMVVSVASFGQYFPLHVAGAGATWWLAVIAAGDVRMGNTAGGYSATLGNMALGDALLAFQHDGDSTCQAWINGATTGPQAITPDVNQTPVSLAVGAYSQGVLQLEASMSELLIYDALSGGDFNDVQSYLLDLYELA